MAEVILDGETVNFEGPPPSSSREVWTLVEGHLGQSGLLIERYLVDGTPWTPDADDCHEAYETIEVFSMTLEQHIANIVETLLNDKMRLLERWMTGASRSLSQPWAHFQNEGIEILNETQPLVECIGLIAEYSKQKQLSWSESISQSGEKLNTSLSPLMDSIEMADCILFSDTAATGVSPALVEIYQILSDRVILSLTEEGANE